MVELVFIALCGLGAGLLVINAMLFVTTGSLFNAFVAVVIAFALGYAGVVILVNKRPSRKG